jgi:arsenate reductase-like glutaredoxin family protein
VLSKRSKAYRERSAEIDAMSDDEVLDAMVAEPTLLRRPLIQDGGQLVVGFDRKRMAASYTRSDR